MKKLISFLLVIMMLCSMSTVAFAADDVDTMMGVSNESGNFEDEAETGSVNTELWLQVEADGQIDVTVPLVLVFKTNIDGGEATSPSAYHLINNSTADLVVTKIETAAEAKGTANPMTLVAQTATLGEDDYKVQLSAGEDVTLGWADQNKTTKLTNGWDLKTTSHENDKALGGLFQLAQPTASDTAGKATTVVADMKTGKLSFVTTRSTTEDGKDSGMNEEYGVKLLTVTYTVAIDTNNAVGAEIIHKTNDTNIVVSGTNGITAWQTGKDNT